MATEVISTCNETEPTSPNICPSHIAIILPCSYIGNLHHTQIKIRMPQQIKMQPKDDPPKSDWQWSVAKNSSEIHELLKNCDLANTIDGSSPPLRSLKTTYNHVRAERVHELRLNGALVGAFTLSTNPPSGFSTKFFPDASSPYYLQRLIIAPKWLSNGGLIGIQLARKACDICKERGADVLRAEINPDLTSVAKLLLSLGFAQCGPTLEIRGRRKAYIQLLL